MNEFANMSLNSLKKPQTKTFSSLLKSERWDLTKVASDSWKLPTFIHVLGCIFVEGMDGKVWEILLLIEKLGAEGEFSFNVYWLF